MKFSVVLLLTLVAATQIEARLSKSELVGTIVSSSNSSCVAEYVPKIAVGAIPSAVGGGFALYNIFSTLSGCLNADSSIAQGICLLEDGYLILFDSFILASVVYGALKVVELVKEYLACLQ